MSSVAGGSAAADTLVHARALVELTRLRSKTAGVWSFRAACLDRIVACADFRLAILSAAPMRRN